MAKVSPVIDEDVRLDDSRTAEEDTRDLIGRVQTDQADMQDWLAKKLEWYERRFSRVDRGPMSADPWAGASTVWLPVSDLYINRTTPFYLNTLFGGSRVARMRPVNALAMETEHASNVMMEHILRGGGVNSMPDFELQMTAAIDSMCTHGLGLLKTYYSYKTRAATETIRRDDLPGVLGRLIVIPGMSDEERRAQQVRFPQINGPEFQAAFGTMDVNPINRRRFGELAPMIERQVIALYGLDTEEPEDAEALSEIMSWLRSGTPDKSKAITKREVVEDTPRIVQIPIQDLIVPSGAMLDFSRAERLTQRMWFTETDLLGMRDDELWDRESIDRALDAGNRMARLQAGDDLTFTQADRASDFGHLGEDELIEIWQTWHYEEVRRKGMRELVVSIYEPNSNALMRKMPFAPDHGQLPITALPFELTDMLYRSPRGIPEMLDDIEMHINAWFRWLENNMLVSTTTSLAVSRSALENPNDITPFPGFILPVDNPSTDIAPIPWPQTDVPIERLEQFYLQWPERLVGGLDTENLRQMASERRTATEVQFIDQNRQRVLGQRGLVFLKAMRKPLREVWQLWKQFGPSEAFVHVVGTEPARVTQHMTRGRFAVEPMVANGQHDPAVRQQVAAAKLQMALQVAPLVGNDPRGRVDIAEAFQAWLMEIDPMSTQTVWKPRSQEEQEAMSVQAQQEAARLAQLRQVAEQAQMNAPITDESAETLLREVRSNPRLFPHGDLQEVIQAARAAAQASMDIEALREQQPDVS